ncbi:MAG TPA: DMT family transporter [Kineosporiaceae bacterium]|nr:DMT family transporter [Kineosporiaceae bacterium]
MTRRGWLLFGLLGVIWGIPYLFIKIAVEQMAPVMMVFGRTALAAAVLLPLAAARGLLRPLLPHLPWIALFAAVEIAGPWALLGYAEQRISSSLAGLLVAAVPLVGAVTSRLLRLDERLEPGRLIGLLVGAVGVAALVGLDTQGGDLLSVGAVGLTAIGYAMGPIIVSTKLSGLPSVGVNAVALGLNALLYAPFAWVARPQAGEVRLSGWIAVAVLGLLCSALAFVLLFPLVAEVGPARTTVITYVNPAVAVTLGIAVRGEPVTTGLLVGFPLVLLGSFLATRRSAISVRVAEPAGADR